MLSALMQMPRDQLREGLLEEVVLIEQMIEMLEDKFAIAQRSAGPGADKYGAVLQGASSEYFYGVVTEVVGEPREEFEKGVEHEHCSCSDSSEESSTSNYGVTTTPRTEFNLVVIGGDMLSRCT